MDHAAPPAELALGLEVTDPLVLDHFKSQPLNGRAFKVMKGVRDQIMLGGDGLRVGPAAGCTRAWDCVRRSLAQLKGT